MSSVALSLPDKYPKASAPSSRDGRAGVSDVVTSPRAYESNRRRAVDEAVRSEAYGSLGARGQLASNSSKSTSPTARARETQTPI